MTQYQYFGLPPHACKWWRFRKNFALVVDGMQNKQVHELKPEEGLQNKSDTQIIITIQQRKHL